MNGNMPVRATVEALLSDAVRSGWPQNGQGGSGTPSTTCGRPLCTTQILAQRTEQPLAALNSAIASICWPLRTG